MSFDPEQLAGQPGDLLDEDRFRQVEVGVAFKRLTCRRCNTTSVYRYLIQQVRRRPEMLHTEDEELRPDHEAIWRSIPRYAEIPQTVKCIQCGEVIGMETTCIY